jgi:hypothetical protein
MVISMGILLIDKKKLFFNFKILFQNTFNVFNKLIGKSANYNVLLE